MLYRGGESEGYLWGLLNWPLGTNKVIYIWEKKVQEMQIKASEYLNVQSTPFNIFSNCKDNYTSHHFPSDYSKVLSLKSLVTDYKWIKNK